VDGLHDAGEAPICYPVMDIRREGRCSAPRSFTGVVEASTVVIDGAIAKHLEVLGRVLGGALAFALSQVYIMLSPSMGLCLMR